MRLVQGHARRRQSQNASATIAGVHIPFDQPQLLELEDDRAGGRAIERQPLGERVLVDARAIVQLEQHAALQRRESDLRMCFRGGGVRHLKEPAAKVDGRVSRIVCRFRSHG